MKKARLFTYCLLFVTSFSFSQWSNNTAINTPICKAVKYQHEVRVVSDEKGGAIAAWLDHRNDASFPTDTSNADIFVQRIDKNGYVKWWLVDGIDICTNNSDQPSINIVTDGASGAIIVWRDQRNGDNDVYAQKVDSNGIVKWASGGVPVCNGTSDQKGAKAVSDGFGGAIVSWEQKGTNTGDDWDVRVQKIKPNGAIAWSTLQNGITISASTFDDEFNARIETDENGGAIIAWEREIDSTDIDIYAQRVDSSGLELWNGQTPVPVVVGQRMQVQPKIEPDGNNGAIIVWIDSASAGSNNDIYAQRINATGGKPWGTNAKPVCTDIAYQGAHDAASEATNGVVIAWKDRRGGNRDVYAQKIDMNGNIQWVSNGLPIVNSPAEEGNPNLWGDGFGNVLCVWQDTMGLEGDVYAQKIDVSGAKIWLPGGVPVATAAKNQTQPKHVPDGSGGLICFFQDNRDSATTNYDIYAQRLLSNGTMPDGVVDQNFLIESKCYPNPFNKSATIQFKGTNYNINELYIRFFNIIGEDAHLNVSSTSDAFMINNTVMPTGIYFYEIISKEQTIISAGKLIITD